MPSLTFPRPSFPVPSIYHQTLLAKALFEHVVQTETIACVAASSRTLLNSSLAPNLASTIPITNDDTDKLFVKIFGPPSLCYPKSLDRNNGDGDEEGVSVNDQSESGGFCETLQFTHTITCGSWPVVLSDLATKTKYFTKSLRRIKMIVVGNAPLLQFLSSQRFSAIEEISILGYYVPSEAAIASIEKSLFGTDATPESNEPTITLRKVALELGQRCDHDDTLHLLSRIPAALELTPNSSFLTDHALVQLVRKLPNLTALNLGFHHVAISTPLQLSSSPPTAAAAAVFTTASPTRRRTDLITTKGIGEFSLACKKKFELSERVYDYEQNWWKPLSSLKIMGWQANAPEYHLALKCICEIFTLTDFSIDVVMSEANYDENGRNTILETIGNLKNLRKLALPNFVVPSADFAMEYFVEKLPRLRCLVVMKIMDSDREELGAKVPKLEIIETFGKK